MNNPKPATFVLVMLRELGRAEMFLTTAEDELARHQIIYAFSPRTEGTGFQIRIRREFLEPANLMDEESLGAVERAIEAELLTLLTLHRAKAKAA
jgi:hypothetical protein